MRILDENDNDVPVGEIGRIHTAQELAFTGYMASQRDKFRTVDGLLEIGDLGRFDEDGFLYVLGRSDDMVIKGGENTFPREVDEVLGALDGVEDLQLSAETLAKIMKGKKAVVVFDTKTDKAMATADRTPVAMKHL